jgi:hypothetical protein
MPRISQKLYVCDRCGRPFQPDDLPLLSHLIIWRGEDDPRNDKPKPSVADVLAGSAEPWTPPTTYSVAHPHFPIPKRRRTYDLALHESCALEMVGLPTSDAGSSLESVASR